MKLLILCVDGFDPDYAAEHGFDKFRHSAKLTIPNECYVETLDGPQPATAKVWASIFSGKAIEEGATVRRGLRKIAHRQLVKMGATWSGKPRYSVGPFNEHLETVFTGRDAFLWNIPTISPEWIARFPDYESLRRYCRREYKQFIVIGLGLSVAQAWDVGAIYTRRLDEQGHNEPDNIDWIYDHVSSEAWRMGEKQRAHEAHLIIISDHGCLDGRHTDHAYIGATFPFEASSILDIRGVIEEALKPQSMEETTNG